MSLGQRIIYVVSENKEQHLKKMKSSLKQYGHPEEVLDYTLTKLLSPSFKFKIESITFVQTYNPNRKFNKNIINNSSNIFLDNSLRKAFENKRPLLATRQAKSLQNLFITARYDVVAKPIALPKNLDLTTFKIKDTYIINHISQQLYQPLQRI